MLNSQLKEAHQTIEAENRNKIKMQENLKKAFMRGVCALNLEAMSALNSENPSNFLGETLEQEVNTSNRIPIPLTEMSIQGHIENIEEPNVTVKWNEVVPKIESKDHMWKPAPILAKDFSNTSVRSMTFNPLAPRIDQTSVILRADPAFDNKREVIVGEEEKEIKCERIPYEANEIETIETRSFGAAKQAVNLYQPIELPIVPAVQPETKVIRVNKYGKSYAETAGDAISNAKYKPLATNKKKPNQFKK